jgi:putative intracellular protease/amidase
MTHPLKILMVLTSHAAIGDTGKPTGVWLEELTTPYYAFIDAGARVTVASIAGGPVPVDPGSLPADGERPASVSRYLDDTVAQAAVAASIPIQTLSADAYDAVFLPGGHGTMFDLPASTALTDLLSAAWTQGKVVAAVCHGPAGLVNVKDAAGAAIVDGRRVTGFSNAEEDAVGLTAQMPFLLETRLRDLGGLYESGPDFQPLAVRDGQLVTGQNPASSDEAAHLTLAAVRA